MKKITLSVSKQNSEENEGKPSGSLRRKLIIPAALTVAVLAGALTATSCGDNNSPKEPATSEHAAKDSGAPDGFDPDRPVV